MRFVGIIAALALILAFTLPAYAETQNVKVSGNLSFYAIHRSDFDMDKNRATSQQGVPLGLAGMPQTGMGTEDYAISIAEELGADVSVVRLGGLMHDIGKVSTEDEGTHIAKGVEIAKRFGLPKKVVAIIAEHHEDKPFSSIESVIVWVADAISGSRPGARYEPHEGYVKRMDKIEEIANSFEGVTEAFAFQAGRDVRVAVNPDEISDDNITILGQSVPLGDIVISVNSDEEFFARTISDKDGIYLYNFDTSILEYGPHNTKSKASIGNQLVSGFSYSVSFKVSTRNVSKDTISEAPTDLKGDSNNDNRVNLVDFSVVAFWYKRPSPPPENDLNSDGVVNLVDLSILAFYWTG